jgi:hypothetical protein
MANNDPRASTSGSLPVATDDVSGVHYQRVKLVDGTEDSSTNIPGDGQGLYVQVRHPRANIAELTITLNSLAASATVGRASTAVNMSSNIPYDVMLMAAFNSTGSSGVVEVYGVGSIDGTDWSGDRSGWNGTNQSYTLEAPGSLNMALIGTVRCYAASTIYRGLFSLRQAFGFVPPWWAVVVVNNTSGALASFANYVKYSAVW